METAAESSGINIVSCVKWVQRGIAKAKPEKLKLTEEELEDIIKETQTDLKDINEDKTEENASADSSQAATEVKKEDDNCTKDEYDFEHYDDENEKPDVLLGIGNLAIYASTSKDPYVTLHNDSDNDSEKEDDIINSNDNLVLVGHVEGDASILEVYVYNDDEGSLYVHHDLLLPSFPLCLEWLSYDPGDPSPGNLCAIGSMSPIVEIWDLDVVDCLEPVMKLGNKPKKKMGIKRQGHRDAVLDLAWNTNVPHVLASGSVDRTVLLWDLDNGKPATMLTPFTDKVQSLQWHPFEQQMLLTGSCDGMARVFDCRKEDTFKFWQVEGEVERVLWNHFDPFCFLVSTNVGGVHYIDCRSDRPRWQLSAHTKEVTGLTISMECPGLLVTASNDGQLKTWDIGGGETSTPVFVSEKNLGVGAIQCLSACPDCPYVVCAGGDKKSNNFGVWDVVLQDAICQRRFASRSLLRATKCEVPKVPITSEVKNESSESMDTADVATKALESLTLDQQLINLLKSSPPSSSKKKGHSGRKKKFRK